MTRRHNLALGLVALIAATALLPGGLEGVSAQSPTRFVAPGGGDDGACNSPADPCGSLGYAYQQATPGEVVEMAAGSYPAQTIPKVAGRTGPAVEFRPAPGAAVTIADLVIAADYVTVGGFQTYGVDLNGDGKPVRGVAVIAVNAQHIWLNDAHDVAFWGGSYGGDENTAIVNIAPNPASTNVIFDGVDFHDALATDPAAHLECIWAGGVQRLTVRNSIFRNCAYFDIFFTRFAGGPNPKDVLLENNVFEETTEYGGSDGPYSVNLSDHMSKAENFTFRNNTFGSDVVVQPATVTQVRLVGNAGLLRTCIDGASYAHNVFSGARCSTTDKRASDLASQFVSPAKHDWRLKPDSAAIDAGDPSDFPATDRFGLPRSGPPDAGAHEFSRAADGGGAGAEGSATLASARLARRRVCHRRRRGCRRSTLLRVVLLRDARIRVRLVRRSGRRRRAARTLRRSGHIGLNQIRIRARGLRRGRYRVVVTVRDASGAVTGRRTLRLAVR